MDIAVRDWRDTLARGTAANLLLTDPPYGTTKNEWDTPPAMTTFYETAWSHTAKECAIVTTTAEPFTSTVIAAAGKTFKYCWYWDKRLATGHLNAKRQPLRVIEPIVVAYRAQCTYHPVMTPDPIGNRSWHRKNASTPSYNDYQAANYSSEGQKYPTTLLSVYQAPKGKEHPTEKPVALMEYLIKTYTDEGDVVVDPFMGTGATAVACKNTNRGFIGGDTNAEYVAIANRRVA